MNCRGGLCDTVTTVIMQKNGAGMIMATSCFWDKAADGKLLPTLDLFLSDHGCCMSVV